MPSASSHRRSRLMAGDRHKTNRLMAQLPVKQGKSRLLSEKQRWQVLPSERERREVGHGSAIHAEIRVSKREQIRL